MPAPVPPIPPIPPVSAPPAPPAHDVPAPSTAGPGVLYQRVSEPALSYGVSDAYWLSSDVDSTFVMIFPDGRTHWGWSGRYSRADSVLVFRYNGWSAAGELAARGVVRGDTLVLAYNHVMHLTDFADGVYVRAPARP